MPGYGKGRLHPPGLRLQAALLASRTSDGEAAARYGVTRRTILRWRQEMDVPANRPGLAHQPILCSVEGCGQRVRDGGRGWCTTHYRRWKRHGDPQADIPVRRYGADVRAAAIRIATTEGLDAATVATGVSRETIKRWCRAAGHQVARPYRRTPTPTLTVVPDIPTQAPARLAAPSAADMMIDPQVLAAHQPADQWRLQAACRGTHPAVWFPDRGDSHKTHRAICHACPVRLDCATTHLLEPYGVWGGLSERQRRTLRPLARAAGWTPTSEPRHPVQLPETGT